MVGYCVCICSNMRLCELLHNKWFDLREEYEKYILGVDVQGVYGNNKHKKSKTLLYNGEWRRSESVTSVSVYTIVCVPVGMCKGYGDVHYIKIPAVLTD